MVYFRGVMLSGLLLAAGAAYAAPPALSATALQMPIPPQPLSTALQAWARESGIQVMYATQLAKGRQSQGAPAGLKPNEALARILAGTGLEYRILNDRTVSLSSKDSEATTSSSDVDATTLQLAEASTQSNADSQQARRAEATAAENPSEQTIQEVIVTATKRAERIQDVPASIAALSADDIARRGLVSSEDYLRGMPGANQVDSNFGPAVVIRGLETTTTSQNFASGSTVAMYFGETPTTSSTGITGGSGADLKLVDIERVEVLRGPQGTAFGNSALGGVVRIIPAAPKLDRFEGKVQTSASLTGGTGGDNHMIQGVANVPLIADRLALRATAYRFEDSGFYRNAAASDPLLQARVATYRVPGSYASDEEEVGGTTFTGGRVAALLQASDNLKFTLTYVNQQTELDAWAGSNRSGYDQAIFRVGPDNLVFGQRRGGTETNVELTNALMEYSFGWADLVATYSHIEGETVYAYPWSTSATGPFPMTSATRSDHSENSAEIRLASKLEGPVNFLVGVYAEKLDDLWTQTVLWYADLATIPFASSVPYTAPGVLNDSRNNLELEQKAAFGEVSWNLLPKLTLTGGVRAYRFDRDTVSVEAGALTSPAASNVLRTTVGHTDASGTTFRGNLSYKLSEDAMVYAGWSEGFRLGKPQPGLPAGACDVNNDGLLDGTNVTIASTREIQSDDVESYELGTKFTLANGRVAISADVFRAQWNEIPVQVRATCAGGTIIGYTANATSAISQGVEGQLGFQVTPALRLDLGASYIDAELDQDAPGLVPPAFKGNPLPSPKVNASFGVQYAFALGDHDAYVRADSIYVDSFNSRLPPAAANTSESYVKIDVSTGVSVRDVDLGLYVRNLTDRDAITFAPAPYPSMRLRPRTIGLQLSYNF